MKDDSLPFTIGSYTPRVRAYTLTETVVTDRTRMDGVKWSP